MKKLTLFSYALAGLMLGACSSDEFALNEGGQGTVSGGEKGYVSLAINLPTDRATRANDNFDDGNAAEYEVKDATLLIFEGNSEAEATFTGAYDLGTISSANQAPAADNITSTFKITQKITKPTKGDLYALVVVNKGDILKESSGTWTLGDITLGNATKLADLYSKAQTIADTDLHANGFFMVNAPLFSKPGGVSDPDGGTVSTLSRINAENVYTTEDEAEANPAASIYVERALAKVTVTSTAASGNLEANSGVTYEIQGWDLDVTNKQTYLVHNVAGANWWSYQNGDKGYRFVGAAAVAPDLYRPYWGIDPNYSDYNPTNVADHFNMLEKTTPTVLNEVNANDYCLENTFNVANQNQNQTTRVIVAAQIGEGSGFYILNNDKGTMYEEEDALDAIKKEYLTNPTVVSTLKANLNEGASISGTDLTVAFADGKETTGGDLTVASITINDASKFNGSAIPEVLTPSGTGNDAIIKSVNDGVKVSYYANGIAYYPVMIKHFGNDQTPWSDTNSGESYPDTDGNAEANWLGRYGVLRNNWYTINVTGIQDIGYAEVPVVYGTPDDPVESWISVEINVLSWAKRSQDVEL